MEAALVHARKAKTAISLGCQSRLTATAALLISALLSLSLSSWAFAETQTLKVAVPASGYPPFIIVEQGTVTGIVIEPLLEAAAAAGIQVDFVFLPERRARKLLDNLQIDGRIESADWVEDPHTFLWTDPIAQVDDVFIYHERAATGFETDVAIQGAEIIAHLGYGYPALQTLFDSGVLSRRNYPSEQKMLTSLLRYSPHTKRAAVMNKQVACWHIDKDSRFQGRFKFSKRVVGSAPLQVQLANTPRLRPLHAALNTQLRRLQADGSIARIQKQRRCF